MESVNSHGTHRTDFRIGFPFCLELTRIPPLNLSFSDAAFSASETGAGFAPLSAILLSFFFYVFELKLWCFKAIRWVSLSLGSVLKRLLWKFCWANRWNQSVHRREVVRLLVGGRLLRQRLRREAEHHLVWTSNRLDAALVKNLDGKTKNGHTDRKSILTTSERESRVWVQFFLNKKWTFGLTFDNASFRIFVSTNLAQVTQPCNLQRSKYQLFWNKISAWNRQKADISF